MANDCLNPRPPKPITQEFAEFFGTDRRVGNTVSLDTRNGTVDVGSDGRLKLEAVESVADLTDADFTKPTRNVRLPKIPANIDATFRRIPLSDRADLRIGAGSEVFLGGEPTGIYAFDDGTFSVYGQPGKFRTFDAERETWEQPVRDAYKDKGEEEILEEIFTHAMGKKGEKLFGKSTNTLQGRQWYKQMWEKIKGLWQDFATKMGWNKADLRGLERMSPEDAAQKILSEMAKGCNFGDAVTGGEGTRNAAAMAKFSSGRDYVHVDTDQNLFDGKPKNTFPKIAHDAIINKFRGKVIGDAPQNAYVKTDTAGEYAYGGKPLDDISKEAKMRSSPELDNILRVGRFIEHKPDDGGHPEAVGGWDYYETIFEVGGKLFSGKVNILNNKKGRVFHDVTDVKEDTRGLMDQYGEPQAQFPGSSRNSVSNPPAESQGGAENISSIREARRVVLPPPPTPPALRGRNGTPPGPRIDVDRKETKAEYVQRKMQDYRAPIKRLEAQIGISDKSKSLYYSLDRHERREAHRKSSSTSVASKNF